MFKDLLDEHKIKESRGDDINKYEFIHCIPIHSLSCLYALYVPGNFVGTGDITE